MTTPTTPIAERGLSRRSRYEAILAQYEAAAEVVRTHADTDVQLQPQDQAIAEEEPEPLQLQLPLPRTPPSPTRTVDVDVDAQLPPTRSARISIGGVTSLSPLNVAGSLLRRGSAANGGAAAHHGGSGGGAAGEEYGYDGGAIAAGDSVNGPEVSIDARGDRADDADVEEGGAGGVALRQLSGAGVGGGGGGGGGGLGSSPFTSAAAEAAAGAPPAKHRSEKHRSEKAKKAALMSTHWLKIDFMGRDTIIRVDKHKLMHKLGVQARDLRLLDLTSVTPPAILGRDKAIIVNLWSLKAIITLDYCLVVSPDSIVDNEHERGAVAAFVAELKAKLQPVSSHHKVKSYVGLAANQATAAAGYGSLQLPFELKVLEVCLDMTAAKLEQDTKLLEGDAYRNLDALPHKVNAQNLEKARRIKNRLVRLQRDVAAVREIMERFLNDDGDMHRLHLTGAEMSRHVSMRPGDLSRLSAGLIPMNSVPPDDASSDSSDSSIDEAETAAVEMLLEAYFMQVDHTYNRLQTVHEYIGDTEDLVTIKLDQHRNQLITIDLLLTSFTTVLNLMTVVGGFFGMNLNSGLQEADGLFLAVTLTTTIGSVVVFAVFLVFLHRKKLLYY